MAAPRHFKPADYGGEIEEIQTNTGSKLYKKAELNWSKPRIWNRNKHAPVDPEDWNTPCLYAIVRDHHRANTKETIKYIGITENLGRRFNNHPMATKLSSMRGQTTLSIGSVDFGRYQAARQDPRSAIEEIEHILIWTLWSSSDLLNVQKQYTLPGMGQYPGRAWHIMNCGHRFAGRMPREIVYPWILSKPGRDRSKKKDRRTT